MDAVVIVIDISLLLESGELSASAALQSQLAAADIVVLNKIDLVSDAQRDACVQFVKAINKVARLLCTTFSDVPLNCILDVDIAEHSGAANAGVFGHEGNRQSHQFTPSLTGGALRSVSSAANNRTDATHGDVASMSSFSCETCVDRVE